MCQCHYYNDDQAAPLPLLLAFCDGFRLPPTVFRQAAFCPIVMGSVGRRRCRRSLQSEAVVYPENGLA